MRRWRCCHRSARESPSVPLIIGYSAAFLLYSTVLRNLPFPPFDWFYVENLTWSDTSAHGDGPPDSRRVRHPGRKPHYAAGSNADLAALTAISPTPTLNQGLGGAPERPQR